MKNCTIVVPCYNEAGRLKETAFKDYLASPLSASVIFVNDGSSDGTLAVLQRLACEIPGKIRVLDKPANAGKAEAVRQGMLLALRNFSTTYVGFWDADLATPLSAVSDLLNVLTSMEKVEIVLGSRVMLMGRKIRRKPIRHYLGRLFAACVSRILHLPVYDSQCGAKLFRATPTLIRVLERPFRSQWIFDVEIIARFMQLRSGDGDIGELIYEFPLHHWEDVAGSKLRSRDFYNAVWELWSIRKTYFRQSL